MGDTNLQVSDNQSDGEATASSPRPSKVIVAVHGIGDQFQFATIQSVANRFCASYEDPQALPLGRFYDVPIGKPPETYQLEISIGRDEQQEKIAFAEIYWADIPRIPEKEGYTLEDSKKWAKTVVDRLHPHCGTDSKDLNQSDLKMAKGILEEILETLTVLERLMFIAEKAGIFKFNLKSILISYLGDVQLVTDFRKYREKIVHRFFEVMNYVAKKNPEADIYIVAHSEGTVVSFLALLDAVCGRVPVDFTEASDAHKENLTCQWLNQVKGLMTIGSPIDKHLIFWRDLWTDYQTGEKKNVPPQRIVWRNYYDYGDPIGFELNTTCSWLEQFGFGSVFEFPLSHNHGFGRYPFPGKAHNDYWQDEAVFDHFIGTVVRKTSALKGQTGESDQTASEQPKPDAKSSTSTAKAPTQIAEPSDKFLVPTFSTVFPYVLVFGLIFLGVYVLDKAVNEFDAVIDKNGPGQSSSQILQSVLGLTCLISGLTIAAQVPRLTRTRVWRFGAFALFGLSALLYWFITPEETHQRLGGLIAAPFVSGLVVTWQSAATAVIALATAIAVSVYIIGRKWPRGGIRVLIGFGLLAVVVTIGVDLIRDYKAHKASAATKASAPLQGTTEKQRGIEKKAEEDPKPKIWPLFIGTAAFLYLWWLAALVFDLVVVWHYYIRRSVAMDRLRLLMLRPDPPKGKASDREARLSA